LWDLRSTPEKKLERVPTPLVSQFKELVSGGAEAVGHLASKDETTMSYV
jgi:hypothetical protein